MYCPHHKCTYPLLKLKNIICFSVFHCKSAHFGGKTNLLSHSASSSTDIRKNIKEVEQQVHRKKKNWLINLRGIVTFNLHIRNMYVNTVCVFKQSRCVNILQHSLLFDKYKEKLTRKANYSRKTNIMSWMRSSVITQKNNGKKKGTTLSSFKGFLLQCVMVSYKSL